MHLNFVIFFLPGFLTEASIRRLGRLTGQWVLGRICPHGSTVSAPNSCTRVMDEHSHTWMFFWVGGRGLSSGRQASAAGFLPTKLVIPPAWS